MSFFNELKRRNVFRVAAAYIIVGWLIMQVGDTLAPALHLPEWINSALAFFLILGFPLALFFAWAFEMTPEGIKKQKDIDRDSSITHLTGQKLNNIIIGLLVMAVGYFAFDKFVLDPQRDAELVSQTQKQATESAEAQTRESGPDENSIAVLPFVNMSDDEANEYFSDGITEELLNLLAKIPELRVTSRSSAFSFKGQNVDIPTVAEKLNVKHVLEGSVRKAGNRVRITAQLIEAGSDVHIWSETYDRELDDVFAIQDEIAQEVVTVLQVQLLGDEVPTVSETDSEAYAYYLQGKHFILSTEPDDTAASAAAYRKAIEIDPGYAPAWAGLARTQRNRANWGQIDLRDGTEEARQAAQKALELDDTLADAWAVLAHIQWVYDWDWNRAEGTVRTALLHGPNDARALETAALIARTLGKMDEALQFSKTSVSLDPLDPFMLRSLALTHWVRHEFDLQRATFERARDLYPDRSGSWSNIAFAALSQGRPEEALALMKNESNKSFQKFVLAFAYEDLGRQNDAEQAIQDAIATDAHWLAYQIAEVFGDWGDTDRAFEWLEQSYAMRDGGITYVAVDPSLEPLHGDPRWEPFLLKVGLLEAWKRAEQWQSERG